MQLTTSLPIRFLLAASLVVAVAGFAPAERSTDWRAWRGPEGAGSVAAGDYADKFGADSYRWRTELPGKACSTPIVLEDRIYLTAPVEGNDALLCYDFHGGEQWRSVFGKEDAGKHRNGSGANASPDRKSVV